jgi:hypothetical protein
MDFLDFWIFNLNKELFGIGFFSGQRCFISLLADTKMARFLKLT